MDKGKAAALLIGLAPKKGGSASPEPSEEEGGEEMDLDGIDMAAADAFAALKADDVDGFKTAFRSAIEIAMASED